MRAGPGVIPSSIVLSAQQDADLKYTSKSKTLSFEKTDTSFLIIDGQHRVYGFRLAEKMLRVPVIIFNGLSLQDETKLFIDINSTQRGVSSELLLDIKRMAEYESDLESYLRDVFDCFNSDSRSALLGRLSPAKKAHGKISRSVFNTALKPITKAFGQKPAIEVFDVLNAYLRATSECLLVPDDLEDQLFNVNVFKAIANLFPRVAGKVRDRFGPIYTTDNFFEVFTEAKPRIRIAFIETPGSGYKKLLEHLEQSLVSEFSL